MTFRRPRTRLALAVLGLLVLIAVSLHPPDLPAGPDGARSVVSVAQSEATTGCHHHGPNATHAACAFPVAVLVATAVTVRRPARGGFPRPDPWLLSGRSASCRHPPPILPV